MTKKEKKMTNAEKTRTMLKLTADYGKIQRQSVRDENVEFLENVKFGLYGLSAEINEMQKQIFEIMNMKEKEINEKFGFLIEALEMGAPPHGGIAFGLDRITMLIIGADSIRETIAFPKNQQAKCLLTNAPSNVSESQLKELDIEITIDE